MCILNKYNFVKFLVSKKLEIVDREKFALAAFPPSFFNHISVK